MLEPWRCSRRGPAVGSAALSCLRRSRWPPTIDAQDLSIWTIFEKTFDRSGQRLVQPVGDGAGMTGGSLRGAAFGTSRPRDVVSTSSTTRDVVSTSSTTPDVVSTGSTPPDLVSTSSTTRDVVSTSSTTRDVVSTGSTTRDVVSTSSTTRDVVSTGSTTRATYDAAVSSVPPPLAVLRAFGVEAPAQPLPGGQGTSWRAGDVVLKPDTGAVHEYLAETLAPVVPDGFRLAQPVPTLDGGWVRDGWVAARWVVGTAPDPSAPSTWLQIVEPGRAFHRALADVDRPSFVDARQDWWAVADRVAWGERTVDLHPELLDVARRVGAALEPLGPSQLVHGDLTNNVLFAAGLPPAVIDISPYWRPPAYAEGVVVADALCWHGASASLLDLADVPVAAVARALLFRLATTNERVASGTGGVDLPQEAERYARAADAIGV